MEKKEKKEKKGHSHCQTLMTDEDFESDEDYIDRLIRKRGKKNSTQQIQEEPEMNEVDIENQDLLELRDSLMVSKQLEDKQAAMVFENLDAVETQLLAEEPKKRVGYHKKQQVTLQNMGSAKELNEILEGKDCKEGRDSDQNIRIEPPVQKATTLPTSMNESDLMPSGTPGLEHQDTIVRQVSKKSSSSNQGVFPFSRGAEFQKCVS